MPSELIAARALVRRACATVVCELADEPDDLDVAAIHVAASVGMAHNLLPALAGLRAELTSKAESRRRDNTPALLAQNLAGHVVQLDLAQDAILQALSDVYALSIHGAPPSFGQDVARALRDALELPFIHTKDEPSVDALIRLHAALRSTALTLSQISSDMRELTPCEHSPAQCEALSAVSRQVMDNDVALNQQADIADPHPIACKLLRSTRLLTDATTLFTEGLAQGLAMPRERSASGLANSLMLVTTSHGLPMD